MTNLAFSEEVVDNLKKIAEADQVSVEELAEIAMREYIARRLNEVEEDEEDEDEVYYPDPEELEELRQAFEEGEAEEAAGLGITGEEAYKQAMERIANYYASKKASA